MSRPRRSGDDRRRALEEVCDEVVGCRACPRLVAWREEVAANPRAAFEDWDYWARPVAGFGDPAARLVIVGLAPAAHGANRTGRMFTGDRSGDWLYGALHRAGYANRAEARARDDGLELHDAWVTAAVRCAPPDNQPTPAERDRCRPFLQRELEILDPPVIVALGGFAYKVVAMVLADRETPLPSPRPAFGHGVEVETAGPTVVCSYHPSQQNTFTGRLTEEMLDAVFARARALVAAD